MHMLPDQKTPVTCLPFAVLVVVALLACACVSAPAPKTVPPPVTPPLQLTGTPDTGNQSTVHPVTPPAIICNCPMEPAAPRMVTPAPTPDEGPCHCP
jgi:hypothetical protein